MKTKALNIITGPLGVGKTTSILSYLKTQAGKEKIGVLVNDFGTIGLDGEFLGEQTASSTPLKIKSIPGGCLCCTSGAGFIAGLDALGNDPELDRIIIEPSGMVILSQLTNLIEQAIRDLPLEMHSTISLIHAGKITPTHFEKLPFFMQFATQADVLVANGEDRTEKEALRRFVDWANKLQPPKQAVLTTTFGQLPPEVFNYRPGTPSASDTSSVDHPHAQRGGFKKPNTVMFHLAHLQDILTGCSDDLLRCKGIMHTTDGWKEIQVAQGQLDVRNSPPREESLMEWILTQNADPSSLEKALLSCSMCDEQHPREKNHNE